jgi:hypothetical protein
MRMLLAQVNSSRRLGTCTDRYVVDVQPDKTGSVAVVAPAAVGA